MREEIISERVYEGVWEHAKATVVWFHALRQAGCARKKHLLMRVQGFNRAGQIQRHQVGMQGGASARCASVGTSAKAVHTKA